MKIVKHSGDIVDFNREKLRESLLKSGAGEAAVAETVATIEKVLYNGIPTHKIYKLAFALLKKIANSHAARYNLRAAIQQLGPAGFFFEKYIARLVMSEGFEAVTNLTLQGKCVSHEVDIATKKDGVGMIECKFHAGREANSDVKVPMYILSRYNDLKDKAHSIFTNNDKIDNCAIVTNNRFTSDAITFATCSGLQLLSWDYPLGKGLKDKIDKGQLYPLTCMTTLTMIEKEKLLQLDLLLASDLINNSKALGKIGLSDNRIKNVLKEASQLCNFLI